MTTQLQATFIAFFSLFLLVGCSNSTRRTKENNVTFDSIVVEKTYHLLENQKNPNCNLRINFTYPAATGNKRILKNIQRIFTEAYFGENYASLTPQEAVAKYAETYLANYKTLEKEFKSESEKNEDSPVEAWYSYYEMSSNKITFNQNDLLCFVVNSENYTGGAHGSHTFFNHVINLKTGSAVTEKEVFIDNYEEELAKVLVEAIAKQNQVNEVKALENMGFFSIEEILPNGNFRIDKTGITYTFNEYEIAAYVVGTINVHLPFEDIRHLLRKESPIAHLVF